MIDFRQRIGGWAMLFLLSACDAFTPAAAQDFGLNRRYDQYAYLSTHNSFANDVEDYNPLLANQYRSTLQQLDGGVRCLLLDTYLARQRTDAGRHFAEIYFNGAANVVLDPVDVAHRGHAIERGSPSSVRSKR